MTAHKTSKYFAIDFWEGQLPAAELAKTVYYSTLILLRIEFVASCQPNKLREVLRSKQMVDKIGEFSNGNLMPKLFITFKI